MKITTLTIDFDITNAKEAEFVNGLLNPLFGGAPLKAMPAPAENPVAGTGVPTLGEPAQAAAPVQEAKEEPGQETVAEAIAEAKEEPEEPVEAEKPVQAKKAVQVKKPVQVKMPAQVKKPRAAKEDLQSTVEPEPVQAPAEEEKSPEKASNEPLTAKDMQAFMIDAMKTGKITRPQLTDIMLEFGGASLMRIKPEKYELLKQRIETYND